MLKDLLQNVQYINGHDWKVDSHKQHLKRLHKIIWYFLFEIENNHIGI